MMGEGAVNWVYRVQKVTAEASSESEYMAQSVMVNGLLFLR